MDNGGDILRLCRLCLVKDDVNIPIFEEQGDIRQIFLKISSCLPVKVSREDKLPKKICDGCSYKLDMLYEFWNTTANAEKQLLSWLGEAGMNAKMADGTISAVAQQIKPVETFVKQEAIDPSDIHTEDDDDKSYMFQQKFAVEEAGPSATVTSNEEEPPPKRARRTAAVKAQIAMDPESDDDDDSGEPMTKVEDESEESEGDDHEPPFVDVPSTSADDQPGPSGVGKDGVEAPRSKNISKRNSTPKAAKKTKDSRGAYKKTTKTEPTRRKDKPRKVVVQPIELEEPIRCKACNEHFKTNVAFALHSITHREDGQYSCHLCSYAHKSKYSLESHVRAHEGSTKYQCEICGKAFKIGTHAIEHKYFHNGETPFQCEVCGKHFTFSRHLTSHRRASHYPSVTGKPPIRYECTICNVSYKFSSSLSRHNQNKHKKVDVSALCDICGKRLSCKDKLMYHRKIHTGLDTHPCVICKKRFSKKDKLVCHMRVHTGEKPYVCKYCGKGFAQSAPYWYHIKVHTGVRPHTCPHCGKGFIAKSAWKNHLNCCKKVDALVIKEEKDLS